MSTLTDLLERILVEHDPATAEILSDGTRLPICTCSPEQSRSPEEYRAHVARSLEAALVVDAKRRLAERAEREEAQASIGEVGKGYWCTNDHEAGSGRTQARVHWHPEVRHEA